jgi:hypothetical protein
LKLPGYLPEIIHPATLVYVAYQKIIKANQISDTKITA